MSTKVKNCHLNVKSKTAASATFEADRIKRALQWCLPKDVFSSIKLHGNATWSENIPIFIFLAVATAWGSQSRMTDAFSEAGRLSFNLFGSSAITTYQGMMRALVTNTAQLLPIILQRFQLLMESVSPKHFRIAGWLPLAVDGSRFSTPRTKSNENAFAAKKYGKGKTANSRSQWKNKKKRSKKLSQPIKPQIWMTLIWHMGLKLPWCWKCGPSNSSERDHLLELIKSYVFPKKTLFCGDAGFTGYEFWSSVLKSGHHFLVRVGGNVNLLTDLGYTRHKNGLVHLWPNEVARKKMPPIVLRMIVVTGERGTMYLVTSVLDERSLSNGTLKSLYPLRWGIELQFRATKQTFGLSTLRSRNSDHALVELNWSLIALTMVQLLAVKEQAKLDLPPAGSSVGAALRAIQTAMRHWYAIKPNGQGLNTRLANAVKDNYVRTSSKVARYRPPTKDIPTTNSPILKRATATQRKLYNELQLAS
jgi:hypothetical protein